MTILGKVLRDDPRLPLTGRTMVRDSFPVDYTWAFATPESPDPKDRLQEVVVKRIRAYAAQDAKQP